MPRKNPNTARAYRERAQPDGRRRLGLLEKRKDYRLRAADHNAKRRKLQALQQKARDRNADEFYFGMMRATTDARTGTRQAADGGRGNTALANEVVQLLKTQDAGYVRTMLQRTRKELERLEQEILVIDKESGGRLQTLKDGSAAAGRRGRGLDDDDDDDDELIAQDSKASEKPRHTVFVDDEDQQKDFDAAEWFGTDERGLAQTYNRPRRTVKTESDEELQLPQKQKPVSAEAEKMAWKGERRQQNKRASDQQHRLSKLAALKQREKSLVVTERELEIQRAKMGNTIGGVNKNGVKFKQRQRKR